MHSKAKNTLCHNHGLLQSTKPLQTIKAMGETHITGSKTNILAHLCKAFSAEEQKKRSGCPRISFSIIWCHEFSARKSAILALIFHESAYNHF